MFELWKCSEIHIWLNNPEFLSPISCSRQYLHFFQNIHSILLHSAYGDQGTLSLKKNSCMLAKCCCRVCTSSQPCRLVLAVTGRCISHLEVIRVLWQINNEFSTVTVLAAVCSVISGGWCTYGPL